MFLIWPLYLVTVREEQLRHYVLERGHLNVLALAWRIRWNTVLATPAQSSRLDEQPTYVSSVTYRRNGLILHIEILTEVLVSLSAMAFVYMSAKCKVFGDKSGGLYQTH